MTTIVRTLVTCGVCSHPSSQPELTSTSRFGSPDLDTRPPALERATLAFRIQACYQCGYCAPDLGEAPGRAATLIEDANYRAILADEALPELARRFAAWGFLAVEIGELAQAGWATLHAAWACDDARMVEAARRCRVLAVARFLAARQKGQGFLDGAGGEEALLADALRRAERFGDAREYATAGIIRRPRSPVKEMLFFELALIEARDTGCYTVEQAKMRY